MLPYELRDHTHSLDNITASASFAKMLYKTWTLASQRVGMIADQMLVKDYSLPGYRCICRTVHRYPKNVGCAPIMETWYELHE